MSGPVEVGGHTRGAFLLRGALAAGALAGAGAVTPFVGTALAQSKAGDVDVLNFALTLEHLEATFYARALEQVRGFDARVRTLAEQLAEDEAAHVKQLTATIRDLGGTPEKRPSLDFGDAFSSQARFLELATTFEDTGVSAYNGAAPAISSGAILQAAGQIVQVEARHAALIRLRRDKPPAPRAFDEASERDDVLAAVKPFLRG